MNKYELEKMIHESRKLIDIRDKHQKKYTSFKRWYELRNYIDSVDLNHPIEAIIHNTINKCMPTSVEQDAVNCMSFLKNLLRGKLTADVVDITKYILKK